MRNDSFFSVFARDGSEQAEEPVDSAYIDAMFISLGNEHQKIATVAISLFRHPELRF